MSAPAKSSRWGSFLQSAVAGVEARLDNILAEEEQNGKPGHASQRSPSAASSQPAITSAKATNDRLQERLAKAVAAKNAAAAGPRPDGSLARQQRSTPEPSSANQSPRQSSDNARVDTSAKAPCSSTSKDEPAPPADSSKPEKTGEEPPSAPAAPKTETEPHDSLRPSLQENRADARGKPVSSTPPPSSKEEFVSMTVATSEKIVSSLDLYEKRIGELERRLEETQTQHQEELHNQVEQVDALQAKLQYLAREATESARKEASGAASGSPEKKLAEKDQQIAGLMEEGQKLAANEQKLRAVIKKLRAQVVVNEKELNDQKIQRQRVETELVSAREAANNVAELKKTVEDSQKTITRLKRELDRAKSTASLKDATMADLKAQLQEESERAKTMVAKVDDQVREAGQQRIKELEDALAALEVEKTLVSDRAKAQATELREKADRADERARAVELEMKGEVQTLESKLEALRATAEEASSGAVGDAQAKLLRQIETLQTQHAIASENWQGMEASLTARAANLEKERDEALKRESEMRRRARETVSFPTVPE